MLRSLILSTLLVSLLFEIGLSSKPPINADFVNGLWARIGKRGGGGGGLEVNCEELVDQSGAKIDLKTFLTKCVDWQQISRNDEPAYGGWNDKESLVNEEKPEKRNRKLKQLFLSSIGDPRINKALQFNQAFEDN